MARPLPSGGPVLCLITDRHLAGSGRFEQIVAEAVAGGVNLVQLREKDAPTRQLLDLALRLREVTAGRALLVVNGRADVAFAAGADGVHLPSDGMPPEAARQILGESAIVGQSVHSVEDIATLSAARGLPGDASPSAQHDNSDPAVSGVDYVELGTIFPSRSHAGGVILGLAAVREAAAAGIPVLAVGGITAKNVASVIEAGAAGVAVISAILSERDPKGAAERLAAAALRAWEGSRREYHVLA